MRLLFKHIRRSIFRAPKETLIILLTVILSATLFSLIGEVDLKIRDEDLLGKKESYGCSDISISSSIDADTRYMTSSTYSSVSDLCESVNGYFAMPALYSGKTARAAAADLSSIGGMFPFSFVDVEAVSEDGLLDAIYISERFAEKNALKIGDEITLSILGTQKKYRIYGINRHPFFGEYDILSSAEHTLGLLSSATPIFAVFDSKNLPYTNIFLKLKEGTDKDAALELLKQDISGSGATAVLSNSSNSFEDFLLNVLLFVFLALSLIVSSVLVIFSLNTLAEKRRAETESFRLSGMDEGKIFLSLAIETLIYTVLGSAAGIFLSALIIPRALSGIFVFTDIALSSRGIITAVIFELIMWGITLSAYKAGGPTKKDRKKQAPAWLLPASLLAFSVVLVLTFLISPKLRFLFAIFSGALLILLIFLSVKPILRFLSTAGEKKEKCGAISFLALKNEEKLPAVHNIYRAIITVVSIFTVMTVCVKYSNDMIEVGERPFDCDYSVIGVPEAAADDALSAEGVSEATSAFIQPATVGESSIFLLSADNRDFLSDKYDGDAEENDIFLAKEIADLYSVKLGDKIDIEISDKSYTFVLQGYSKGFQLYGYIDAKGAGFSNNLILIRSDGNGEILESISSELSLYGGMTEKISELTRDRFNFGRTLSRLMTVYMAIIGVLTLIGCFNLAAVSFAERKSHFASLRMLGISKKELARMIISEGIIAFFVIVTVSLICSTVMTSVLDSAFTSFGYSLY